VHKVRYL